MLRRATSTKGGATMTMQPIRIADVPPAMTVFQYLRARTDYAAAVAACRPRVGRRGRFAFDLGGVDLDAIRDQVVAALERRGFRGWRHAGGESRSYGGMSLTWNPEHQDAPDPEASTLGTPRNARDAFFWNSTEGHAALRDSYFDSYGFRRRTELAATGPLGSFVDGFSRSLVRSRVGVIPGAAVDAADGDYLAREGWHRDEPVFETLRLNIPLVTDPNFVFQMAGEPAYHLETGRAYTWDTNRPHRVFCRGATRTTRIHLVLGFAPWFDYLPDEEAWVPNAHFGRTHPFDMLAQGLLHPAIRLGTPAAA
jgi:hypothetical protein